MSSLSTEPWDKLGNNVDNCEDLDYKCAKSASSDDDVAYRQVTISLTLGRTGWKAAVIEVKAEEACAGNNTVEGVVSARGGGAFNYLLLNDHVFFIVHHSFVLRAC
jgi:hypothetical protein